VIDHRHRKRRPVRSRCFAACVNGQQISKYPRATVRMILGHPPTGHPKWCPHPSRLARAEPS
jgi:hypothetical protein